MKRRRVAVQVGQSLSGFEHLSFDEIDQSSPAVSVGGVESHWTISTAHSITPRETPNARGKPFLSDVGTFALSLYYALCRWQPLPVSANASHRICADSSFATVSSGTAK